MITVTTEIMEKPIRDTIKYLAKYKDCIMMVVMMSTKMIYDKGRKTLRMQAFGNSEICVAN